MATRFINPSPQFTKADGSLLAGGFVYFYENGTTVPKDTYNAPEAGDVNENPVQLDSSGRFDTSVFLDGDYSIKITDALGVNQPHYQLDDVGAFDAAATVIPALEDGKFLTNDGAILSWQSIVQVPDMAGSADRVLSNDGENAQWIELPAATVYDADNLPGGVEQGATSMRIGNMLKQFGSGTAPTSGTTATSVAVTWAEEYDAPPIHVSVTPNVAGVTSEGAHVSAQVTGISATGATVHFFAGAEDGGGALNISTAIPFTYEVTGIKAPAA